MNFSAKGIDEAEWFGFDFSPRLASGETIQSATFAIAAVDGSDPAAPSMLQGVAMIDGATVRQKVTGGVAGLTYRLSAHITTSNGQTLVEPVGDTGALIQVKANG